MSRRRFFGSALGAPALAFVAARPVADPGPFPPGQRAVLVAAMDEIVPAGPGMPSASEAGCLDYLGGESVKDAGLRAELSAGLQGAQAAASAAFGRDFERLEPAERVAVLRRFADADPVSFRALRDAVYEAYYTRPDVWRRLGYEFYGPERSGPVPAPFDASVLARVRTLPALYRVPGA
jgi:hypothetical protein